MGVIIEDIRISNEFTSITTDYLLGNIGGKITIEVDFRAEEFVVTEDAEDVDRILLAPQPFRVDQPEVSDIIFSETPSAFENFRVGDIIGIDNTSSGALIQHEIYEKIDDQIIRVKSVGGTPGDRDFSAGGTTFDVNFPINSFIALLTDLTAISYRFNFVGNLDQDVYTNKIDNELNQLRAAGVDNTDTGTVVPLVFDNPKTNVIGSASVKGNGSILSPRTSEEISQRFTITHNTFITPWILAGGLLDLKDLIAPDYFSAENALKAIFSIDVGRNSNDPNFIQTVDFIALDGNTGWFNENFNGGNNNYTIDSVTYKRLDTTVITATELITADQTIEIVIKNIVDTPFSDNNTEFALNFSAIPNTRDEYTGNNKTIIENFYFDRAFQTVGSGSVAGENFGTDQQIIKDVVATFVSSSEILITATISMSSFSVADLIARTALEYFFWVAVQNHTLETEEADRVALKVDVQPFFIDLTDDGLIEFAQANFLRHYETDVDTEGTLHTDRFQTIQARPEDDILTYKRFDINRLGRESDEILITSVKSQIIAKKLDGTVQVLETFEQGFNGTQIIGDTQFIDTEVVRAFQMPDNEQRKLIKVKRRIDLDTIDLRAYEIRYPFLMRWEFWEPLAGVDDDFFDVTESNNGQNHQWQRYDQFPDWDIYYRTIVNLTKNGEALTFISDDVFVTFDYLDDEEWINESVVAVNADTEAALGTLLPDSLPIKIIATKEFAGVTPPLVSEVEWVMRVHRNEQGGINDVNFISSVYDWILLGGFKSLDTSNKIIKSVDGLVYKAEALIDPSLLPDFPNFKISARIYDTLDLTVETCCITTEAGDDISLENGEDCIAEEDCGVVIDPNVPYTDTSHCFETEVNDTRVLETGGLVLARILNMIFFNFNFVGITAPDLAAVEYELLIVERFGGYEDLEFNPLYGDPLQIIQVGNIAFGQSSGPEEDDLFIIDPDVLITEGFMVIDCFARSFVHGFELKYRFSQGNVPTGLETGFVHKIVI